MSSSWYRRGTVTVTDGSKEVVGVGTLWVDAGNKPLAGDIMFIAGSIYEVESITDNEHLSLFRPFTGVPPANGEYAIIRNTSVTIATRVAAMVAAAINSKQVLLDDLRGYYTSTADKVLIHTDDGSTIEVVPLQTLVSDITNLIAQSESIKNDLANTQAALDLVRQYSNAAQGVEVEPDKYSAKSYAADAADTLALVNKAKSDVDLKASQVQQTKTDIEQFVSTSKTEIDAKATAISKTIDTQATTVKGEIADLTSTSKQEITALATKSKKDITTLTTTSKSEISELVAGGTNSITSLTDTSKGAINTLVSASKTEITELATTEKAAISQQSTTAISEMTSLKQSAEQAASTATQKATQAAASATSAAQSKTDSQALKTQTEALANETKQVAEEIKSGSYVGWQIYCESEANMKAQRALASNEFAASGFVHYGKHVAGLDNVNEGLWVRSSLANDSNHLYMGRDSGAGTSKTDMPVNHVAGIIFDIVNLQRNDSLYNAVKFPEAPDGTVTYNSATGEVIQHADAATAFALADTSDDIEVVINRVDMFGAEFFLEEVSQTNPFVYPKGMIQSQATSMNGITTTTSNRPVTYYAVYDGDTGSQGRGVDFWAATDEQKKALVSDETNNIFMLDDGRLVQWRMRQRTIAGAGNGDWDRDGQSINPVIKSRYGLTAGRGGSVPQGYNDTIPAYGTAYWTPPNGTTNWNVDNTNNGVYQASGGYGGAPFGGMFGLCFFHVWGVVPRLNQGAYHPSLNPMGARRWRDARSGSSPGPTLSHSVLWYDFVNSSCVPTTTAQAFNVQPTGVAAQPAASSTTGFIGAASPTGRDDGKLYDAIYASGQGGVIDYRLPSWDMSSKEEASKVFQKVVNGTYRGEEELIKTVPLTTQSTGKPNTISSPYPNLEYVPNGLSDIGSDSPAVGALGYYAYNVTKGWVSSFIDSKLYPRGFDSTIAAGHLYFDNTLDRDTSDVIHVVMVYPVGSSVSGEFTMVDVIGNPAEILATPALANGWLGGWIPVIPDGSSKNHPLTRKAVESSVDVQITSDNGGSWVNTNLTANIITNTLDGRFTGSGEVTIYSYTAFAKQTVEANNDGVFNVYEGIGNVFAAQEAAPLHGTLLAESLMGKVLTSGVNNNPSYNTYVVKNVYIHPNIHSIQTWHVPEHEPINLNPPTNDSPAYKTLWYQTANNQQVSLNFAWNELVWKDHSPVTVPEVGSSFNFTQNDIYYVRLAEGTSLNRSLIRALVGGNLRFADYIEDRNGVFKNLSGADRFQREDIISAGWGDDSTIRITDGTGTFINLNGDTCLYGTHELAIPYGYIKNKARAGSQVSGVDL
ncbi:TPA: hypothetical protein O4G41_000946 [Vibrio alginolyticus]|uniref:hypothetical protein n=1 Tax=Vibrio alginolyticus TaxID=663 RepID=UPI000DFC2E80|nr:hypothetical protein [Vibrio alginolyticus]MBS9962068.1 hypothetical protein [Vibrio alginolyticus]SUP20053.1 Uncharacterised protein [Vibrio alginolyticus]HCZ9044783.1 hypothetical protein [Vibrio alginolyticus]HCZ9299226.1 hypothetical protein [Vibrio alginolyticus]